MTSIPGTFPPGKTPQRATSHRIGDIRQRKPYWVNCTCGWLYKGVSADDIERAWKNHKAGPE